MGTIAQDSIIVFNSEDRFNVAEAPRLFYVVRGSIWPQATSHNGIFPFKFFNSENGEFD